MKLCRNIRKKSQKKFEAYLVANLKNRTIKELLQTRMSNPPGITSIISQ